MNGWWVITWTNLVTGRLTDGRTDAGMTIPGGLNWPRVKTSICLRFAICFRTLSSPTHTVRTVDHLSLQISKHLAIHCITLLIFHILDRYGMHKWYPLESSYLCLLCSLVWILSADLRRGNWTQHCRESMCYIIDLWMLINQFNMIANNHNQYDLCINCIFN